jgi:hypothetical protein
MGSKENQHYIPQGYLRGFTIPKEKSLVWEYDKESGQISRDARSVREICSQFLYYAQIDENGQVDQQRLEDAFQVLEDKVPRIIRSIQPSRTGEQVTLSGEEHGTLSFFIALLLTRGPSFRDGIEDIHRRSVEVSFAQYVQHAHQKGTLPAHIKDLYEKGQLLEQLDVEIKPQVSLQPMIALAQHGSQALLAKLWSFALPATDMFFVTADNPVSFQLPEQFRGYGAPHIGPFHPLSEVTIPLRKDLALICSPSVGYRAHEVRLLHFRTVQLNRGDTKNINKRTAIAARRYVYAPEKSPTLAHMVGRLKGTEQRIRV